MIRSGPLDRLIADERAGRADNAKQIWQLLTMELWYRNAQSMGVAA
jgi:asparagine synthase (glutamine-hydrolysing)